MSVGFWQVLLILLIVLILFGSGKLPKVMEDLAKGFRSFREGMNGENEQDAASKVTVLPPPSARKKSPSPQKRKTRSSPPRS